MSNRPGSKDPRQPGKLPRPPASGKPAARGVRPAKRPAAVQPFNPNAPGVKSGRPTVRGEAIRILARVDSDGGYADILIDHALRTGTFPDMRDRALLTELVMGTLRRRGTLDTVLRPHLSRSLEKTDPSVRNALRLAVYQLMYMRVPERAALFETVEAVKALRGEQVAGFANGVLRSVLRDGTRVKLPEGPWAARVGAECSAPEALATALMRTMGGPEATAYLAAALEKPPFTVRANPFGLTLDALMAHLAESGREPEPCRYAPDGIVLRSPSAIHTDTDFRQGRYLVMDEGAQLIAPLLHPSAGDAILDACAAPGGKTAHLSGLSGGKASITATDVSEARVSILRETIEQLRVPGVETCIHDWASAALPGSEGRFDKALVDAPCTGMGIIRRNPDAKWRFDPEGPARMAVLQLSILRNVWTALKPGGMLLYCTCSPLREEDEQVVEAFVADTGATRIGRGIILARGWPGPQDAVGEDGSVRLYPHRHGTDGFFAALLRKD
ncbi:MAG TPA: 16S rRNA (cytosine(967)-C(5))-methyltransferase RsmB [Candidatus Deferrimicrobiaceae bacterium]|jgi:16S rRNA (cytosine967-C5)-methyltransferase